MESLHELDRHLSGPSVFRFPLARRALGEIVAEAPVWCPVLVQFSKHLIDLLVEVDLLELAFASLPVIANYIDSRQPCGLD